jgi:hypothetical protein
VITLIDNPLAWAALVLAGAAAIVAAAFRVVRAFGFAGAAAARAHERATRTLLRFLAAWSTAMVDHYEDAWCPVALCRLPLLVPLGPRLAGLVGSYGRPPDLYCRADCVPEGLRPVAILREVAG